MLAIAPDPARRLAGERGYVPATVPLVKRIAALPPDRICAVSDSIFIDGQFVATRLTADGQGRGLPVWTGCRVLGEGEVFLLTTGVPDSFDSRYFGTIAADNVLGRLVPLWTW